MAFQDIVSLLQSEADEKAAELLASAEEKKTELLKAAKEQVEKISADQDALLVTKKADIVKKTQTELLQKGRLMKSQMQQSVLDATFDALQSKIEDSSGEDLEKILRVLLSSISDEKGEVVALGKTDEKILKKAVKGAQKKFLVSSDSKSLQSGFLFKGEGFTMDFSFDALVKSAVRPKYEAQIFKKLFG